MNIKALNEQLGSLRQKEKEYVALAQQASGAVQILEHLIGLEEKAIKPDPKAV